MGAFNLGEGRPNRIGRALVSYVSDYVRHVTQRAGQDVWDRQDVDEVLDQLYVGSFLGHENHRTSADLVRVLIERGFIVDCIYDRAGYLIEDASRYDCILDEWDNLPRWASTNPKARKCFYGTGCHWISWNQADLQRVAWLFQRKGVALAPPFQLPPLLGLADAKLATYYGNDAALQQFGVFQPKMRKLWVCPSVASVAWKTKKWDAARRSFLYFGSSAWLHRGLDLVIEAFLKLDFDLYICGSDRGFLEVYGAELKQAPNIHYEGFVTPGSDKFKELTDKTVAVVYPSAAEGCSTSVLQCMRFGLIPLVTEATGLSIHNKWPPLKGSTDLELIEDLRRRCVELSDKSSTQLDELSRCMWDYASNNHSRPAFRTSLDGMLDELLA